MVPVDLQLDHGGGSDLYHAKDLATIIAAEELHLPRSHTGVRMRQREIVAAEYSRAIGLVYGSVEVWLHIGSIAAALLERERLTGDEVRELLEA